MTCPIFILALDYIDLFYLHYPVKKTNKRDAISYLHELKQAGKIKAIGVSNSSLDEIKEANQDGWLDVVQDEYNLLNRDAEQELFPYLQENNISFIPFFPLASGLLTGKYQESFVFPEDDLRSKQAQFQGESFKETVAKVNQLKPLAVKYNTNITNIVLSWYLMNDAISAIIPGAKQVGQVADNMNVVVLEQTDFDMIDALFS